MARGIQPSPQQILEERQVEATSILFDAVARDRIELSDLRIALDSLIAGMASAGPDVPGLRHFEQAAAKLSVLLLDDLTENRRHRDAIRVMQGVSA